MGFHPGFVAATATVNGDEFALLHIKLLGLVDHPLVMPVAAERLAPVFLLQARLAEGENLSHESEKGPLQRSLQGG